MDLDKVIATIDITEMSTATDDFDTENGLGFDENLSDTEQIYYVEVTRADVWSYSGGRFAEGLGYGLTDYIQDILDSYGVGEWDGANTSYDPDGSRCEGDGYTTYERWAEITILDPDTGYLSN